MYADPVPRLIMVEGTIGSGKTTTASGIHRFLKGHHIASELFLAGDIHNPADFEHTAWLGTDDWVDLLSRWPTYRTSLEVVSQPARHGWLVPYGALTESLAERLPDGLLAELAARSVYDGIPLDRHRRLLIDRWRVFAQSRQASRIVTILECCFLQNPLMKFVVQLDVTPSVLVEHLSIIAEAPGASPSRRALLGATGHRGHYHAGRPGTFAAMAGSRRSISRRTSLRARFGDQRDGSSERHGREQ